MNDENENNEPVEEVTPVAMTGGDMATDFAAGMITALQAEVDEREVKLTTAQSQIQEVATPVGDSELRALASTVRNAQRNGHPDADKHLDALLTALGAA